MNANDNDTASTTSNESEMNYEGLECPPPTTDKKLADAIIQVFDALAMLGVNCEHNWSCCNTCGYSEMENKLLDEGEEEGKMDYVFYHLQESERLANGQKCCYLNHCFTEETKKAVLDYIAKGRSHLHWDGNEGKKLIVSPYPLTDDE
jgi:hypothetical protein